ncbi:MAG: hypothetical protein IKQ00_04450 [Butyrivibrio sp.]|nr:hypothetical protein [Butyrivibrio sp.]MBR4639649.1 hypothetical protein [Butyrivibrio sp.]
MINAELYTEFKEVYTDKDTVNRVEFCKKLKKLKKDTVVELNEDMYCIYTRDADVDIQGQIQATTFQLEIEPAARVRFEGSLEEYECLLDEINKKSIRNRDFKIYGRLKDGNADREFFIMDVYYLM